VFEAVQQAQRDLVQEEMTKVYMSPQGDAAYLEGVQTLVLGEDAVRYCAIV
jgi:aspartate/tyrosine/aromatic aminotransferase